MSRDVRELVRERESESSGEVEVMFAKALIAARRHRNMTQKDLCESTGITQSGISMMENSVGNPSLRTLQRLADGLDMKLTIEFVPKEDGE